MKSIITLALVTCFLNSVAVAVTPLAASKQKSTKDAAKNTKETMNQFLTHLTALKKFMVSQEAFIDPKNSFEISTHLADFSKLAREAHENRDLQATNFKFSREVLSEHLEDTERLFRLGNKSFARWKFSSTISVCMSCHSQMPAAGKKFTEFKNSKSFTSKIDQAEFLFAIRDFEAASSIYDSIILNYKPEKGVPEDLDLALGRQLVYFGRMIKNPTLAIQALQKYQKNNSIPEGLQSEIKGWIKQFEKWNKEPLINSATATEEQVLQFARDQIDEKWSDQKIKTKDPNFVTYLRVSGLLYEFLRSHPNSAATPEILYWLSICDRAMNNTFFYSLADMYLRECIMKYPESAVAKKCYKEFETETRLGYTGSRGLDIPPEVLADLEMLKKLVEPKK